MSRARASGGGRGRRRNEGKPGVPDVALDPPAVTPSEPSSPSCVPPEATETPVAADAHMDDSDPSENAEPGQESTPPTENEPLPEPAQSAVSQSVSSRENDPAPGPAPSPDDEPVPASASSDDAGSVVEEGPVAQPEIGFAPPAAAEAAGIGAEEPARPASEDGSDSETSPAPLDTDTPTWSGEDDMELSGDDGVHSGAAPGAVADPLLHDVSAEPTSDALSDAQGVVRAHLKGLVEALVFASDVPCTVGDLAKAASADRKMVREVLDDLMADYRGRGIQLMEIAGGYSFRTSVAYAPFVRDVAAQKPVKMTRAQLETLAIVAYRQPLTRPEIDEIRGVDSGPVLKMLLERDLIRILGKRDEPGRPLVYGTTARFLEFFNLKSLKELPTLKEFTELSDDSRRTYEKELGEEAPSGTVDPASFLQEPEGVQATTSASASSEPAPAAEPEPQPDAAEPEPEPEAGTDATPDVVTDVKPDTEIDAPLNDVSAPDVIEDAAVNDAADAVAASDAAPPKDGAAGSDGGSSEQPEEGEDGGCSCRTAPSSSPSRLAWLSLLGLIALRRRKLSPHT